MNIFYLALSRFSIKNKTKQKTLKITNEYAKALNSQEGFPHLPFTLILALV